MTAETLTEDATTVTPMEFVEPGVYDGMPEDVYHADPIPAWLGGSLSASGARRLLPPSCPAIFDYQRKHPPEPSKALDIGRAAHALVLGVGAELAAWDGDDWRSKASQEFRATCRENGVTPLLAKEFEQVTAMAEAIRQDPTASALFDPDRGLPEQSLLWQDDAEQPWRRARLDWMPHAAPNRRYIIGDYKTAQSASPDAFPNAAAKYGYAMQAAWYIDGITALGIAEDPAFVFIVQEKTPPYLITAIELDGPSLNIGRAMNRRALDIYAQCVSNNEWPGYSEDVELVSLPIWFMRANGEEVAW